MDIFEKIGQEAQKAGAFLVDKATVAKDYTVASWNAMELKNKINELYKSIGIAVYNGHINGEDPAQKVHELIEQIHVLKETLKEKEAVRRSIENRKVCPDCNKNISKDHSFCPHCGKKAE